MLHFLKKPDYVPTATDRKESPYNQYNFYQAVYIWICSYLELLKTDFKCILYQCSVYKVTTLIKKEAHGPHCIPEQ